jgi:isoleucyl-tRNA synthetase
LISNTHSLIEKATKDLDEYNTTEICSKVLAFVDDLSTWYVRRSRDRFKSEGKEKDDAVKTLAFALDKLSKVLAPITPFISEEIYQSLRQTNFEKNVSVHLENWPLFDKKKINEKLSEEMILVREIVSKGLDERVKVKIPVKQPLASATLSDLGIRKELFDLIKDELNVKEIKLEEKDNEVSVSLDTKISPELEEEGASRELIRKINDMRKKMGLTIQDRVQIKVETESELIKNAIEKYSENISSSAQADKIELASVKEGKEFKIKEKELKIELIKN